MEGLDIQRKVMRTENLVRTENLGIYVVVGLCMLGSEQSQLFEQFLQLQINCSVDTQAPDLAQSRFSSALTVYQFKCCAMLTSLLFPGPALQCSCFQAVSELISPDGPKLALCRPAWVFLCSAPCSRGFYQLGWKSEPELALSRVVDVDG